VATPQYDFDGIDDAFTAKTQSKPSAYNPSSYTEPNVLNQYASYNYLFTLSGLSNNEIENPINIVNGVPHDVVARSGGIGTESKFSDFRQNEFKFAKNTDKTTIEVKKARIEDVIPDAQNSDAILKRRHDIFFEKVNITSVPRPNEERKLMNFTKIEMELSEPLGVTLFEKLRACAFNNGYVDHNDAPFLLTIEFRGYDSNGKMLGNVITKRHLPIIITNAEMDVTQGGTRYSVTAVPWTEFAMSNRFLYSRAQGSTSGKTAGKALQGFFDQLNEAQNKEIESGVRTLADDYVITLDSYLDNAGVTTEGMDTEQVGITNADTMRARFKQGDSIAKVITDVMLGLDIFRDIYTDAVTKYWNNVSQVLKPVAYDDPTEKYLPMPDPMVGWFKILTTIYTEKDFDTKTKMHKKVVRFHVEPYKVHILNFTVPGLGGNSLWGKTAKKDYNYIFTGKNTEIIDLKINYKYSYFQSRLLDTTRSQTGIQPGSIETDQQKKMRLANQVYGSGTYPEPSTPLRSYPDGRKAADGATEDRANRSGADEFFQYLTSPRGDMVKVDLTIMGDPAFIGQDMFLPMSRNFSKGSTKASNGRLQQAHPGETGVINTVGAIKGFEWDSNLNCFNFDQAEPLVRVNFKFPTDINENQGLMDFSNLEDVKFNGLYRVSQVESIFDQGTFTQQLLLVRLNNQTGNTQPDIFKRSQGETDAINKAKAEVQKQNDDDFNDIVAGTVY
tara:strand:+ start:174 stop:2354 length:2181 start_codon:yes stop_codon:yes gene_type:complete